MVFVVILFIRLIKEVRQHMYDTLRVAQLVVLMTNFIFEGAYFFT